MDNKVNGSATVGGTGGFAGLLTIAFIVLKLCHVINWSWVWVLSPLWISAALALVVFIIIFIVLWILNR